jgi:murein DD-endopeptidase MepM/ murein hydrolase activator NlpD
MRREREDEKGKVGKVALAGLGGFLLGAATILFVVWIYGSQTRNLSNTVLPAPQRAPVPAQPSVPQPVQPPAFSPSGSAGSSSPSGEQPAAPPVGPTDLTGDLSTRHLLLPVQGIRADQLHDTFNESRGGGERVHEALDIMAPIGSPVLAVEDGRVAKLFTSKQGGLTVYQFDPTETYAYYYAHLDHYADGLKEGDILRRGQIFAYVGVTGNARPDGPHLHFAIFRLTPEKQWWKGDPVNPFGLLR